MLKSNFFNNASREAESSAQTKFKLANDPMLSSNVLPTINPPRISPSVANPITAPD